MSLTDMYVSGLLIYRFVGDIAVLCVALTKSEDVYNLPNAPKLEFCTLHKNETSIFIYSLSPLLQLKDTCGLT
jgi:hypothetical protein